MGCGFWETLGWVGDPEAFGLTNDDLILDKDGNPCLTSWIFNPFGGGTAFIDISTEKARAYIKRRTVEEMKFFRPEVIKLDYGYGIPGPQMGVPRNPELRGEKYAFEMIKLISEAAKSVNPDVTILYYCINPLFQEHIDIVSLDDQGDMWYAIKEGHDQWSIWASLLSNSKTAISGSSSYDWDTDDEVILNSFILGSPNAVLPTQMPDGSPVPEKYLNRRLAINKWYRRTILWEPLWINSHTGNLTAPPNLNCWGRMENKKLTALVLRGEKEPGYQELAPFEWKGRWAIIAQDDKSVAESSKLAVVPFDEGQISIKASSKPKKILVVGLSSENESRDWTWEQGFIKIKITNENLSTIAGFLIDF